MRLIFGILVGCALAGCVVQGGVDQAAIHHEFNTDRVAAIAKYRPTLTVRPGERATAEQLIVAGELMAWDSNPAHYAGYEQFVFAHMRGRDGGYRSSALTALHSARGVQSLAILFDALQTFREPQAHSAMFSLRNRYAAAKGVNPQEQAYIEQQVAALRKRYPDKRIQLELPHDGLIVDDSF